MGRGTSKALRPSDGAEIQTAVESAKFGRRVAISGNRELESLKVSNVGTARIWSDWDITGSSYAVEIAARNGNRKTYTPIDLPSGVRTRSQVRNFAKQELIKAASRS